MTDLELKMLNMKKTNRQAIKEARDLPDAHEGVGDKISGTQTMKLSNDRKRTDVKDTVQFKRKKAKVMIHYHILLSSDFSSDLLF